MTCKIYAQNGKVNYDCSARNAHEEETKLMLQAEYLVRVTDETYISCRADPSFLGNFFFDTAMYDNGNDGTHIALGPRQTNELIYPLDKFIIGTEESQAVTRYAEENLATMEQLVDAIPKVIRSAAPTSFSANAFYNLSSTDQHLMLSLLSFAKRRGDDGDGKTVFGLLPDRGMIFDILSFIPVNDSLRQAECASNLPEF